MGWCLQHTGINCKHKVEWGWGGVPLPNQMALWLTQDEEEFLFNSISSIAIWPIGSLTGNSIGLHIDQTLNSSSTPNYCQKCDWLLQPSLFSAREKKCHNEVSIQRTDSPGIIATTCPKTRIPSWRLGK